MARLSKRIGVERGISKPIYIAIAVLIIAVLAIASIYLASPPTRTVTTTITSTVVSTSVSTSTTTVTSTSIVTLIRSAAHTVTVLYTTSMPYTVTNTVTKTVTHTATEVHTITKTAFHTTTIAVTRVYPVEIVDALNRTVTIGSEPKRVVSLAPSITEILFALGLGEKVVGVDQYSNYPPEVVKLREEGKIAVVGGYWNPDMEKILALKPDLVIASASVPSHVAIGEKLEKDYGIRVLFLKSGGAVTISDVFTDIWIVATVFGVEDRALELVLAISRDVENIVRELHVTTAGFRKVMILLGPPSWGYWTTGSGTFIDELITLAGGINVFSDKSGYIQVSKEDIIERNPEILIVTVMGGIEDAKKVYEEIVGDEALSKTDAVKSGRVYILVGEANDIVCRPGPRIVKALNILVRILHPEIFGEITRADIYVPKSMEKSGKLSIALIEVGEMWSIEALSQEC